MMVGDVVMINGKSFVKWTGRKRQIINKLYKDFNIHIIEAKSNINFNGKKRENVEEVIITNYENNYEF